MTDKNTALRNAALYAAQAKVRETNTVQRNLAVNQSLCELRQAGDDLGIDDINESGVVKFLLSLLGLE